MALLTGEDRNRLKGVLTVAEEVLGECSGPWADLLFPEPLRQDIRHAWPEVKSRIQQMRRDIDRDRGKLAGPLANAGLIGKPLKAKTTGLFGRFAKFKRLGSLRLLKKVLKWLNTLLGSLASAIPGGDIIKEHKEAVELGIEEAEDSDFEGGPVPKAVG